MAHGSVLVAGRAMGAEGATPSLGLAKWRNEYTYSNDIVLEQWRLERDHDQRRDDKDIQSGHMCQL